MDSQPRLPISVAVAVDHSGHLRPLDLVQDYNNFKRSAAPARFLRFANGSWLEFDRQVFDILLPHFLARRTAFDAAIGGVQYLFDFIRMLQVDLNSSAANSIAWVDVERQCFFPKVAVDEPSGNGSVSQRLEIEIRVRDGALQAVACRNSDVSIRESVVSQLEHSDESPDCSRTEGMDRPRWPGVVELCSGDKYFKIIEKMFMSEMRRIAPEVVITGIHKCSHSGPGGSARLKAFQARIQAMNALRGDAQVKIGWFGALGMDLPAIIDHGFRQPNNRFVGSEAFGVGFHISALQFPHLSSVMSETEDGDEKHLVLCRVIMGKSEIVEAGSRQYRPSSDEFDSGVDCVERPKWYVVWSNCMNTHILPECIVSFKCPKQNQGLLHSVNPVKKPEPSNLSFTKLIAELGRVLPSSMIQTVQISYKQFKGGRINKDTFIRCLRSIVGDKLLTSSIRKIRGY